MNFPALRFKDEDRQSFPEWKETSLGEIAKIIGGGTPDTSVAEYWGGNVQWFTPTEIKSKYASNSLRTITESGLKDSSAKLLPVGTLLFSSRATVGDVSIALNECTTNQGFQSMVVGDKNNKEFIYYWILNNKKTFLEKASGSTFLEISKKEIEKLPVQLPSIKEQTKIANFLTAVDEKITQLTQKHDLLTQYKKGVMQQIFSQELRFKDDDGREFPEWADIKISELNLYISDGNYGEQYPTSTQMVSSGVPFIRANNIKGQKLVWDDMKFITPDHHKILTSGHLLPKDILITTRGEIGTVALVQDEFGGSNINAQICLLRVNDTNEVAPEFLLQELTTSHCQKQIKELQTGSALKQLPKSSLGKVSIKLPCVGEQTKIANFLIAIDDKISVTQTQLNAVKQYKQGLLQQMFV